MATPINEAVMLKKPLIFELSQKRISMETTTVHVRSTGTVWVAHIVTDFPRHPNAREARRTIKFGKPRFELPIDEQRQLASVGASRVTLFRDSGGRSGKQLDCVNISIHFSAHEFVRWKLMPFLEIDMPRLPETELPVSAPDQRNVF